MRIRFKFVTWSCNFKTNFIFLRFELICIKEILNKLFKNSWIVKKVWWTGKSIIIYWYLNNIIFFCFGCQPCHKKFLNKIKNLMKTTINHEYRYFIWEETIEILIDYMISTYSDSSLLATSCAIFATQPAYFPLHPPFIPHSRPFPFGMNPSFMRLLPPFVCGCGILHHSESASTSASMPPLFNHLQLPELPRHSHAGAVTLQITEEISSQPGPTIQCGTTCDCWWDHPLEEKREGARGKIDTGINCWILYLTWC